jgi:hypothetical protein
MSHRDEREIEQWSRLASSRCEWARGGARDRKEMRDRARDLHSRRLSRTRGWLPWKSWTNRYRSPCREIASRIRDRRSPAQYRADAGEPAQRRQDPRRRVLSIAGGTQQETVSHARGCGRLKRAGKKNKNAFRHGLFTREAIEERKHLLARLPIARMNPLHDAATCNCRMLPTLRSARRNWLARTMQPTSWQRAQL